MKYDIFQMIFLIMLFFIGTISYAETTDYMIYSYWITSFLLFISFFGHLSITRMKKKHRKYILRQVYDVLKEKRKMVLWVLQIHSLDDFVKGFGKRGSVQDATTAMMLECDRTHQVIQYFNEMFGDFADMYYIDWIAKHPHLIGEFVQYTIAPGAEHKLAYQYMISFYPDEFKKAIIGEINMWIRGYSNRMDMGKIVSNIAEYGGLVDFYDVIGNLDDLVELAITGYVVLMQYHCITKQSIPPVIMEKIDTMKENYPREYMEWYRAGADPETCPDNKFLV